MPTDKQIAAAWRNDCADVDPNWSDEKVVKFATHCFDGDKDAVIAEYEEGQR